MKKVAISLIFLLTFLLSGCSAFSFEESDIMCPPKATGSKAEIQKLIDKNTSGDYTLEYPKNGDNRSSIVMHDIDNDEDEDAIAFYTVNDDTQAHALFVQCNDDEYIVLEDVEFEASGIDRVDFCDINGDSLDEILIGYSQKTSSLNTLNIFRYTDKITKLNSSHTYSNLVSGDFNSDKKDDILLISLYSGDTSAKAKLMTANKNSSLSEIGSVELDSDVTQLADAKYSQIEFGVYGAAIDGITSSGDYTTQVIVFDSSAPALLNPLFSYSGYSATRRTSQICSEDFDEDELIDIPVCSIMSYDEKEDASKVSRRVDWSNLNIQNYSLTPTASAIFCPEDGYFFTMPKKWLDCVTARYDESKRETTIYSFEYVNSVPKKTAKLMTIKAFPSDEYDPSTNGYTEIINTGATVYAYSLSTTENYLSITGDEINTLFRLVNQ